MASFLGYHKRVGEQLDRVGQNVYCPVLQGRAWDRGGLTLLAGFLLPLPQLNHSDLAPKSASIKGTGN